MDTILRVFAWLCGTHRTCVRCGRWYDYRRTGGRVILETWGPVGDLLGQCISHETCHRCVGEWYDADYVHHADGYAQQVNSKAGVAIRIVDRW